MNSWHHVESIYSSCDPAWVPPAFNVRVVSSGVYKASEARLLLLMYQVNYVNQGTQLKDAAITPAKIIEDSWTMDGFVSEHAEYRSLTEAVRYLNVLSICPPRSRSQQNPTVPVTCFRVLFRAKTTASSDCRDSVIHSPPCVTVRTC